MSAKTIGRRNRMEFTAGAGKYFPPLGQVARGASPQFALGSGCIGAFDTTTLIFSASSVSAGLATLTAKGYLPNVTTLNVASFDIGQAHFSTHAFTTPSGLMVGQISLSLASANLGIPTGDALPTGTLIGLFVNGSAVVYAPSNIGSPISFAVPVTVAFLGDVSSA